ncbi:MAG: hypothetical protein KKH98_11425, partial [Spirochaetes bacterium]|nr:hypothetical protein [Spirochaetota bacterium]
DNDTGACMMYFYRPLVCRLFSNAAVINKYEKAEISLCRILSGSRPELKEHIQKAMGMGLSVPVMRNYSMMIYNIHPELGGKYYPINTAFKKSLEIVSLSPKNFSNNRAA